MTVRTLSIEDWAEYREIRLEALAADPGAFASTYEREAAFDEATWQARLTGFDGRPGTTLLDEIDGRSGGTGSGGTGSGGTGSGGSGSGGTGSGGTGSGGTGSGGTVAIGTAAIGYTEFDPAPMLVAMWVRPSARGTGAGTRLVAAAVGWADDRGADEVVLWVVRDNLSAIRLYERCGFVASGKVDTVPSNPCAEELEMRLDRRIR